MSILKNAVDSITLGTEDFNSTDTRRLLSCTRNLFAGILLLFKYKLSILSPPGTDEVLVKQLALPTLDSSGQLIWKGKGKKTVDVSLIRERFESLGIDVEWKRVERINKHRNEIEHYYTPLPHSAVRGIISDSFIVIRSFIRKHLGKEPLELLGTYAWTELTKVAEVYEEEKRECNEHLQEFDWESEYLESALIESCCLNCGSGLIDVSGDVSDKWKSKFKCRSCGEKMDFEKMAESAIADFFALDSFLSVKDGGEPAVVSCPSCGKNTYIIDENICVMCGSSVDRICKRCGCKIPACELDGDGYCSYCFNQILKDD